MEKSMKPTRLFCRLGKSMLLHPETSAFAVRKLEAAGVGVFIGGLPSAYGSRASSRRHGLLRIHWYEDAMLTMLRTGSSDSCLESVFMELEPHFTGMQAAAVRPESRMITGDLLTGKLMWWCGLENEAAGPGRQWFEQLHARIPWFCHGVWPTGRMDKALDIAVASMLGGADAVMCAGPGIREGAPLVQTAKALVRAGVAGIDAAAIECAVESIMESVGMPSVAGAPTLLREGLGSRMNPVFGQ